MQSPAPVSKKISGRSGDSESESKSSDASDFESILKPTTISYKDKRSDKSYTEKINEHIPSGFCVYSKFTYGDVRDTEAKIVSKYLSNISKKKLKDYIAYFLSTTPWTP